MVRWGGFCEACGMNENTEAIPKRRRDRSQIDALLNRFHESGLSVRAFCEREQVADSQLYKWLRRERDHGGEVVEVDWPVSSDGHYRLQWANGRHLTIPYDAPEASTARLIRMLERL